MRTRMANIRVLGAAAPNVTGRATTRSWCRKVASVAESTSSSTDVCPSYESFPSSLQAACSMDIDDDVMGYINSQGDRDLWALVQFEENSVYTVKVHGDVDPNNKLGGARIQLFDQWGIPRAVRQQRRFPGARQLDHGAVQSQNLHRVVLPGGQIGIG